MQSCDQKEIKRYLNVIKRAVSYLEAMLDCEDGGLLEQMVAPPQPQIQQAAPVPQPLPQPVVPTEPVQPVVNPEEVQRHIIARKKHVGDLMAIDCWPEAVPAFLLAKAVTPQENKQRATSVLDFLLDRNLEGLNFLDFGCGEGWITKEALSRGVAESVGYDIKEDTNWGGDKGMFTTSLSSLKKNHFDIVMLYDVLDHCHDPVEVMSQVKQHMKRDGSVYVRCHPWTSKHAMHLHKSGINKAYMHLFLHWHELTELIGSEPQFTRIEMNPVEAYHWWFNDGFEVKKEKMVKEQVSPFFYEESFKVLLKNEHGIPDIDGFLKLMEIQFIDYVLKVK